MVKKQHSWLIKVLALSGCLNVVCLLLFYSLVFKKDVYQLQLFSGPMVSIRRSTMPFPENFMDVLAKSSLDDLMSLLDSSAMMYGRPVKNWALGAAVSLHGFDLVRAVGHAVPMLVLHEESGSWYIPDELQEQDYALARQLYMREKYPLTSRGIFRLLAKQMHREQLDEELLYLFCNTPEFIYFRTLLAGADEELTSLGSLLRMVVLGGEELFFSACCDESRSCDVSPIKRVDMLRQYMLQGLSLASVLLLHHDRDYIIHYFSDCELDTLLSLLPQDWDGSREFLQMLAVSPRGRMVRSS